MTQVFRGIDIAGDQSMGSGVADLVGGADRLEVRLPEQCFSGFDGIDCMRNLTPGETIVSCAIDQPLGFPHLTLQLLNGARPDIGAPSPTADAFRYRYADRAMREWLASAGLKRDFVRPPVVCDNIWRALYLLGRDPVIPVIDARLGRGCWFETHPRLTIAALVSDAEGPLVARYKQKLPKEELLRLEATRQRREAREQLLNLAQNNLPLLQIRDDVRASLVADDNKFEALFCAIAAYAKSRGLARRFPSDDPPREVAEVEGFVFTVQWSRVAAACQAGN